MRRRAVWALPEVSRRVGTVWRRNLDVFAKTLVVNFLPPLVEPVLYLVAMGFGLGVFVSEIDGMRYAEFIAPALVAITIMYASFFECTYASFVRMYYQKTFDAIVAAPMTIDEVITGEILWGATRSAISAALMLLVIAAFGLVRAWSALLVIPLAFLGGFMFAAMGMCFTAITPKIENLNYPTSLFITPMFLVSGTFFPLSGLPIPVQTFANAAVPLVHVVTLTRAVTYGQLHLGLLLNLAWIAGVSGVVYVVAVGLMRRRLVV